jgi:predicted RNase H-like nuclease (RuvC/YqgF family)
MPIPLIPIITATVASAIVVGATIYFFVSNNANQKRVEYMTKVNEVLELLQDKVKQLKALVIKKEEKIRELEKNKKENEEKINKLTTELEENKVELKQAQSEKNEIKKEYEEWKKIHDKALSGFTPSLAIGAIGLVKSSAIFKENKYKPKMVFEYINRKKANLSNELSNLMKAQSEN